MTYHLLRMTEPRAVHSEAKQGNVEPWGFRTCSSSRMCDRRVSSPWPEMRVLCVFRSCAGLQHQVADGDFQAISAHRPLFYNSWIKSTQICPTIQKATLTTSVNTSVCLCGGGGGCCCCCFVDIQSIYGICPQILRSKAALPHCMAGPSNLSHFLTQVETIFR